MEVICLRSDAASALWISCEKLLFLIFFITYLMLKTNYHKNSWCCELHLSPAGGAVTPAHLSLIHI